MIITFGPKTAALGDAPVGPVPRRPVAGERPAQDVDVVVGDLPAAVEPLVDDERVLVHLREEVPLEVRPCPGPRCPARRRSRPSRRSPSRPCCRLPSTQSRLRRRSSLASGSTVTVRLSLPSAFGPTVISIELAGRVLEQRVDLGRRLQVLAVDREQVLALLDVHARGGQRRAQLAASSSARRRSS